MVAKEEFFEGALNTSGWVGFWLIVDGVLSIVKYEKQTLPEQLIRVIRAIVGITIVVIGLVDN